MLIVASREQLPPFLYLQHLRNFSQVLERWLPPSLNTPAILSNHSYHTLVLGKPHNNWELSGVGAVCLLLNQLRV